MVGALIFYFFLFTDKKTRVGVDTGSVGLVETRVFFIRLNIKHHASLNCVQAARE